MNLYPGWPRLRKLWRPGRNFNAARLQKVAETADGQVQVRADIPSALAPVEEFERSFHVIQRGDALAIETCRGCFIHTHLIASEPSDISAHKEQYHSRFVQTRR